MLKIKVDGTFSDDLPRIELDGVIDVGTVGVFDALDIASWPSQGQPDGNSEWLNLVINGASATFQPVVDWQDGFVFSDDGDQIVLPNDWVLTDDTDRFVFVLWASMSGIPATLSGVGGVASTTTNSQYYVMSDPSGAIRMGFAGCDEYVFTPQDTSYFQIGIAGQRRQDGSGFDVQFFKDGVLVGTAWSPTSDLPSDLPAKLGNLSPGSGVSNDWLGRVGRAILDNSDRDAADIVADDYAANYERFNSV